jgi:hypothetical protein
MMRDNTQVMLAACIFSLGVCVCVLCVCVLCVCVLCVCVCVCVCVLRSLRWCSMWKAKAVY